MNLLAKKALLAIEGACRGALDHTDGELKMWLERTAKEARRHIKRAEVRGG